MSAIRRATPNAARLVCAVADGDVRDSHRLLSSLTTIELQALAIVLASSVDPDAVIGNGTPGPPETHTLSRIVQAAAEALEVPVSDVYERIGRIEVAEARQVAMWVALAEGITSTATGRHLHRDHSTVLHGADKVTRTPRLTRIATRIRDQIREDMAA